MIHLSEEQLVLHYYGEEGDALAAEQHLDACADCRAVYGSLQRVLNAVDGFPLPERDAGYGALVWRNIEDRIGGRRPWRVRIPAPFRWAAAGAALAGLLTMAFLAGRYYPRSRTPGQMAADDPHAGERVLLIAVGDYLERSRMVLIELANANPARTLDISAEQARASDLVSESRLYRQTAEHAGEAAMADALDDVSRVLLDIAHAPSPLTPAELEKLRRRLEAEGILFKIRVLETNVRSQEETAPDAPADGRRKL